MGEKAATDEVSARFCLSSFLSSDIDEVTRLLQNAAVLENLAQIPIPFTRKAAVDYFHHLQDLALTKPEIASMKFTIRDKSSEKPVGRIDIMQDGVDWKIGYWLGQEYWGQGIMTWACGEVVKVAKQRGIPKLQASPRQCNLASRKVLERNRFEYIRDEKCHFPAHGKSYDCWIFENNLENM